MFEVVREDDCVERGVTPEASYARMRQVLAAMRRAADSYCPSLRSASGMVGGDGEKMRRYVSGGRTICSGYMGQVIAQALEMGETEGAMSGLSIAVAGIMTAILAPVFVGLL